MTRPIVAQQASRTETDSARPTDLTIRLFSLPTGRLGAAWVGNIRPGDMDTVAVAVADMIALATRRAAPDVLLQAYLEALGRMEARA